MARRSKADSPLDPPPASDARRKLVEIDEESWQALDVLARDSMRSFQELSDEAFGDLLKKHGRPVGLRAALKQSAKLTPPAAEPAARKAAPAGRRRPG